MSNLTTQDAALILDATFYESFPEFQATLSAPPKQTLKNKFAGNAEYVPISLIEADLDNVFGAACWKMKDFQLVPLGASTKKEDQIYVAATLELEVLHPITRQWITRAGAASGYVSHNTITTFATRLKANALKNASKSLGKVFGRDLNRDDEETETTESVNDWLENEGILDMINAASSLDELSIVKDKQSSKIQRHPQFRKALNARAKELK